MNFRIRQADTDLPPEFQQVADLLAQQLPEVREIFRYVLVLALLDDERTWVVGTRREDGVEWFTLRCRDGHLFEVPRPESSEAEEAELMKVVRESRNAVITPSTGAIVPQTPARVQHLRGFLLAPGWAHISIEGL